MGTEVIIVFGVRVQGRVWRVDYSHPNADKVTRVFLSFCDFLQNAIHETALGTP